jgi:hypothetical protein
MKLKATIPTELEVDAIRCHVAVRYGEEDMPNDFPFRTGDMWDVTIDLKTRKIRSWPARAENIYMKICDEGNYYLMAGDRVVASREGDYVPDCIPGEYGDYIDFKILEDGTLDGWEPDADQIKESFFRED